MDKWFTSVYRAKGASESNAHDFSLMLQMSLFEAQNVRCNLEVVSDDDHVEAGTAL